MSEFKVSSEMKVATRWSKSNEIHLQLFRQWRRREPSIIIWLTENRLRRKCVSHKIQYSFIILNPCKINLLLSLLRSILLLRCALRVSLESYWPCIYFLSYSVDCCWVSKLSKGNYKKPLRMFYCNSQIHRDRGIVYWRRQIYATDCLCFSRTN